MEEQNCSEGRVDDDDIDSTRMLAFCLSSLLAFTTCFSSFSCSNCTTVNQFLCTDSFVFDTGINELLEWFMDDDDTDADGNSEGHIEHSKFSNPSIMCLSIISLAPSSLRVCVRTHSSATSTVCVCVTVVSILRCTVCVYVY
jgi:hypothetical protein